MIVGWLWVDLGHCGWGGGRDVPQAWRGQDERVVVEKPLRRRGVVRLARGPARRWRNSWPGACSVSLLLSIESCIISIE